METGLLINEKDLKIKYGMYNLRQGADPTEMALASFKYIATDVRDIKTQYIRLGFHLNECNRMKYYEEFGYLSFAEFVEANFGMDKSAASRCMNVADKFCHRNTYSKTMFLDDRYVDYSYSQLCEMLPLSDNQIRECKPTMTVKEIREMKKAGKNQYSSVATSQPEKVLTISDLADKKGIVLQNHIRSVDSLGVVHLLLFNDKGKKIANYLTCDILLKSDNSIVLRIVPDDVCPGNSDCLKGGFDNE